MSFLVEQKSVAGAFLRFTIIAMQVRGNLSGCQLVLSIIYSFDNFQNLKFRSKNQEKVNKLDEDWMKAHRWRVRNN